MALPRILLAVPLIAAGMYLPAAGADPAAAAPGVLGMQHEHFAQDEITVKCGQTLPMVNNSRWVHIIGPGEDGLLTEAPRGVPVTVRFLVETYVTFTTGTKTLA